MFFPIVVQIKVGSPLPVELLGRWGGGVGKHIVQTPKLEKKARVFPLESATILKYLSTCADVTEFDA